MPVGDRGECDPVRAPGGRGEAVEDDARGLALVRIKGDGRKGVEVMTVSPGCGREPEGSVRGEGQTMPNSLAAMARISAA